MRSSFGEILSSSRERPFPTAQESWFVEEQGLVLGEGSPGEKKQEEWASTIGGDKFVRVFSELQKDILFTSFASPRGIQSLAKSLDWSKLRASCHSAWVKSICSVLPVNSLALSGFDGYFDELPKVCRNQQETVNEISSPCATILFIPISLWMMSCHLQPQAAISMIYQCHCDQNANDDAGSAIPDSSWAVEYSLSLPTELGA